MEKSEELCPICLEAVDEGVRFCSDNSHECCCKTCIFDYIKSTINGSFFGTCPSISCPSHSHHAAKKRRLLRFDKWGEEVPSEILRKYISLAKSLLAFQCGGCHVQKSLDVGSETDSSGPSHKFLQTYMEGLSEEYSLPQLKEDISSYMDGVLTVEDFYTKVTSTYFYKQEASTDSNAWDTFQHCLKLIVDPERRANLHLRYLRDHPRIKTTCCQRVHCFRCKVKDFHEGRTCLESIAQLDHSVVNCPTCGIALAKGDGCNSITCVCGKNFSWSDEKRNMDRCVAFLEVFPYQTSAACADLLCTYPVDGPFRRGDTVTSTSTRPTDLPAFTTARARAAAETPGNSQEDGQGSRQEDVPQPASPDQPLQPPAPPSGVVDGAIAREEADQVEMQQVEDVEVQVPVTNTLMQQARAWQTRHRSEVRRSVCEWFKTTYAPCPSQCCAILTLAPTHSPAGMVSSRRSDARSQARQQLGQQQQQQQQRFRGLPQGLLEAAQIWCSLHPEAVDKYRREVRTAVSSLLPTLCTDESGVALAANRLLDASKRRILTPGGASRSASASEQNEIRGKQALLRAVSAGAAVSAIGGKGMISGTWDSDPLLVQSAQSWVGAQHATYQRALEEADVRSAKQFLYLHGHHALHRVRPAAPQCPTITKWSTSRSDPELVFSNGATTVERKGNVSCYPAAFARLPAERAVFRVNLDAAPITSNWLTFGLARATMPRSGTDGMGRTSDSWGFSDDRSSSSSPTRICCCGREVGVIRKLEQGDTLSAVVDVVEGWCEVSLNTNESAHRFNIPPGTVADYFFGMTLANNHSATVLSVGGVMPTMHTVSARGERVKGCEGNDGRGNEPTPVAESESFSSHTTAASASTTSSGSEPVSSSLLSSPSLAPAALPPSLGVIELNHDRTLMFLNYKKQLVELFSDNDVDDSGVGCGKISSSSSGDDDGGGGSRSRLLTGSSQAWIKACGGSTEQAMHCYELIKDELAAHISSPHRSCGSYPWEHQPSALPWLTWNLLLDAATWFYENRRALREAEDAQLAFMYCLTHAEDAPFMAAMQLANANASRSGRSRAAGGGAGGGGSEERAARAFMCFYAEEMQQWYEYDASAREPMLENVAPQCRCLPRHTGRCPFVAVGGWG